MLGAHPAKPARPPNFQEGGQDEQADGACDEHGGRLGHRGPAGGRAPLRANQAVRLVARLVQPVAEVLPLVEQLVDVERVARAAAVRDRGPDEGGRAHGLLADAAQRVDDGHAGA